LSENIEKINIDRLNEYRNRLSVYIAQFGKTKGAEYAVFPPDFVPISYAHGRHQIFVDGALNIPEEFQLSSSSSMKEAKTDLEVKIQKLIGPAEADMYYNKRLLKARLAHTAGLEEEAKILYHELVTHHTADDEVYQFL